MASFIFYIAWIVSLQAIPSKHHPNYHANHSNTFSFRFKLSNSSNTFSEGHTQDGDTFNMVPYGTTTATQTYDCKYESGALGASHNGTPWQNVANYVDKPSLSVFVCTDSCIDQITANATASNQKPYRTCTPTYERKIANAFNIPFESQTSHVLPYQGNDDHGLDLPIGQSSSLSQSFCASRSPVFIQVCKQPPKHTKKGHNEDRDAFNTTTPTPHKLLDCGLRSSVKQPGASMYASSSIQNTKSKYVSTAHDYEPEYQLGYAFDHKTSNTVTVNANYKKNIYVVSAVFILFSITFTIFSHKQGKGCVFVLLITICLAFTSLRCSALGIVTSGSHTCAWSSYGTVKCFGQRSDGQLGYGEVFNSYMGNRLPEVDLGTDFNVTRIVAGGSHTCMISSNNRVKCIGWGWYGQLGYGDLRFRGDNIHEMGDYLLDVDLGTDFNVTAIVAGGDHTCALSTKFTVKCFGRNLEGQLGYGDQNNRGDTANEMGDYLLEVDLGTDFKVTEIIAGGRVTCALSRDNTVKCWGWNNHAQLGYSDSNNRGDSANEMGDTLSLVDIGEGFATRHPTSAPSMTPTSNTEAPTNIPSVSPTATTEAPTYIPSFGPSVNPVRAPTPQDIHCNDPGIVTEIDGEYSYYLYIDAQSIVRFDTCGTLKLFDIFIVHINDINENYSCIECGSICYELSQYQVTLSIGQYRMDIHGPHAFKMVCTPKSDTDAPTSSPIASEPTRTPSGYPTVATHRTSISFPGDGVPISAYTFLSDPYGRFEAYIDVVVHDAEGVLKVTAFCAECFIWQYRLRNDVWTDIDHATNNDISVYNQQITATTDQS
eukprot:440334_1